MSILNFNYNKYSWEESERKKVLALFENYIYGVRPPESLERFVYQILDEEIFPNFIKRHLQMTYQDLNMNFYLFLPRKNKPCPAFVFIMHPAQEKHYNFPKKLESEIIPLSMIIKEGFALAVLITNDIAKDEIGGEKSNLLAIMDKKREPNSWKVISAWALGASKVLDYLETLPEIDSKKVATIGHSRGGKTALWAGATDSRFALAISSCSGNTGAALSRGNTGETVKDINERFPHWFCDNYKMFNERENSLPVDQHLLIALQAPRLCYVSSATEDEWADPDGELLACKLASKAYELYKEQGLLMSEPLKADYSYSEGHIGYHRHTGKHLITHQDWEFYLSFFKKKVSQV
jgi:hypothetical protein